MITAQDVATLREMTGVGLMDCKRALTDADGNIDKAIEFLRERGMASAAKKAGRIAAEGIVESYIHMGGKIGVLLEVNCETDFVAKGDIFRTLVKDIAMQIAATKPLAIRTEELDQKSIDAESAIYRTQIMNEGKPAAIVEKAVEGRIKKYYKEVCLLEQPFVKDDSKTVQEIINEATLRTGEKISVRRFVRYEMGEGLEKRSDNFAEEVAQQMNK